VLNAQVPASYRRTDPVAHIAELLAGLGLAGEGVGLLTAASVPGVAQREDEGVWVAATVGLRDAAYVNAVMTATETKTQAVLAAGFRATGTASDAICVAAPAAGEPADFAGPRSTWGARIARAVYSAVHTGALRCPRADRPAGILDG
jgi:adenosylcobinamide amidohydrolase